MKVINKKVIGGFIAAAAILLIAMAGQLWENTAADEIVINQVPITGELEIWTEQGMHFQKCGDMTRYQKTTQMWFSNRSDQGSSHDQSKKIVFNDAGKGWISGSARIVMPRDKKHLSMIQEDFGSMSSIMTELVDPTMAKVIFATGPLMSSYESYASKKNELISYIDDQLQNGIYKTTSSEVKRLDEMTGKEKTVTLARLVEDPAAPGGFARQEDAPFGKYGITIRAVTIEDIKYEDKIEKQIAEQQNRLMSVQTAIAAAKEAQQNTIRAEEEGKANAAKAKWVQEVINAKEVAVAEKNKRVAEMKAEQQLQVAKLEKKAAEETKQKEILLGQGEATRKKLVMQADGALELKLDAWVASQQAYASALKGAQLVPMYVGGTGANGSNATDLIEMLKIKTAKDLSLDMSVTGSTK